MPVALASSSIKVWLLSAVIVMGITAGVAGWRRLMRRSERANRADWGQAWINRIDGLTRLFCRRFHRLRHQTIPLPTHGPAIVVANHVSGLDPLLMIASLRRPLRFIIAREQYERWGLRWLFRAMGCIPVNRAANPRAALSAALAALKRGEVVALFPQGRILHENEAPTRLKAGVLYLAKASGAPIYPMRITGVRAQGYTVAAVFIRSRVRVKGFPPSHYAPGKDELLLEELKRLLTGRHK